MTDSNVSPEVLSALETLERASAPTDLGRPYQVLLDWRRKRPASVFALNALLPVLPIAALAAIVFLLSFIFIEIPDGEYWRGAQMGFTAALLLVTARDLIFRRGPAPPPESIERRIESAIDRWRHAMPAMRDLPK